METENARPVQDRDTVAGVTIAAAKADAIDKAARDKKQADSERRLYFAGDENLKKSGRIHVSSALACTLSSRSG